MHTARVFMLGLVAAITSTALISCGVNRTSSIPPTRVMPTQHTTQPVAFSIKIPSRRVHTMYISPATVSAIVMVTGAPSTTLLCSTTLCTGQVVAPVGTDTFTVDLCDCPIGSGGYVLSTGTVTQTIIANQANTVNVAFEGVIASLTVTLNPNGVTIGTSSTVTVNVNARDHDGYAIIGSNPYSQPVTLQDNDLSGATTLSKTTVTSPTSIVTLSYNGSSTFESAFVAASIACCLISTRGDTLIPAAGTLTGPATYGRAWGPPAVANALGFPVQGGYNGAGQTVAIIMDSYPNSSDLGTFESYFQIPVTGSTVTLVPVDGGPTTSSTDASEAALDAETVAGLAPGANIVVYGIPSLTGQYITDAYNRAVGDGTSSVVSFSAGGCESSVFINALAPVLQSGVGKGVLFVASAGDQGNECSTGGTPQYQVGVNYPASDVNVIGVGGTESLPPNDALTSTIAWNDSSCASGQCATGGGVSASNSLPTWQQFLGGVNGTSTHYRNVPDIAMPAEGAAVYVGGAWTAMNGTSWSAPELAAMLAEVNEYCNTTYANPNQIPYTVFQQNPSAFIDVMNGNNQFSGSTPFYTAGPGFDNVSGVGVPKGMAYANTICPGRVPQSLSRRHALTVLAGSQAPVSPVRDVTPHVLGLIDRGDRDATSVTRIQLTLLLTTDVASHEQQVASELTAHGFSVTQRFANHLVIDAEASSAIVAAYFQTRMHNVDQPRYGMRYLPSQPATLPASIAAYVSGLTLDNLVTVSTQHE